VSRVLLSIGMIVKNEEQGLRECLNGIKPILEQVDSELIIADTGSTDATVAIAKEFTDNVYQIEWRNDFAWARNTTLERAKGEWYMFLDGDEIFQDISEIVGFFNSGEYKEFGGACHLRYEVENEIHTKVYRLFKKDSDTVFVGKVHENALYKRPVKMLGSVSLHTGYSYGGGSGKEKQAAKYERNLNLLLEMHEENPADLGIIWYIVRESMMNEDYVKSERFLDIGLKLQEKDSAKVLYHSLRQMRVICYVNTGQFQKALDEIKDYFDTSVKLFSFAVGLRLVEAGILSRHGRHEGAILSYKEAIRLFGDYNAGFLDKADEGLTITAGVSKDTEIVSAGGIAGQYAALGDFDGAFDWVRKYKLDVSEMLNALRSGPGNAAGLGSCIKASYKYLLINNGKEEFDDNSADSLSQRDRFIYYAHKAYERKDRGDTLGFVSNLREAVKLDPSMRNVVMEVINSLEITKRSDAPGTLSEETAALKGAIYELIKNKQLEVAAQILDKYALINPGDPDINVIRARLAK